MACGEVLQWRKLPGSGAPSAVDALGNEVPVASGAEQGSWSVDATEWPGHVVLSLGEREAAIGAVNLPHRESSLDVRWAETLEGEPLNNTTPLAEQLAMHRRGREFAGALLLAALAVLALESLVARETGREVRGDGGK